MDDTTGCGAVIRFGTGEGAVFTECYKSRGHRPIGATNGHQANIEVTAIFGDIATSGVLVEVKW